MTAAVASLAFAAAPACAEGEGNGDQFALHVPGQAACAGSPAGGFAWAFRLVSRLSMAALSA